MPIDQNELSLVYELTTVVETKTSQEIWRVFHINMRNKVENNTIDRIPKFTITVRSSRKLDFDEIFSRVY